MSEYIFGTPYKKILVGADLSDGCTPAFYQGLHIARLFEAEIHVIHVVEPISSFDPGANIKRKADDMQKIEDHVQWRVNELFEKGGVEAVDRRKLFVTILSGKPYEQIVKYAESTGIDLIVMGAHGKTGFQQFLTGSQTEKVLRTANCHVLCVREPKKVKED